MNDTNTNSAVTAAVNQALEALTFKGASKAGLYLAEKFNIDPSNGRDCIYKALKHGQNTGKTGTTHGYMVTRNEATREVILTPKQPKA